VAGRCGVSGARRAWSARWLVALAACAAAGCGGPVEHAALPEAALSPWRVESAPAPVAPTPERLRDRSVGRSGFACADCHATGDDAVRPAPRLVGTSTRTSLWSGATDSWVVAVNLCVERYLDRPALPSPEVDGLVAAIHALPRLEPTGAASSAALAPIDGAGLYDAACRHCHEGGPAGPVLSTRWTPRALTVLVRGWDRPAHPATHMPAFGTETLSDAALAALVEFVADAPAKAR